MSFPQRQGFFLIVEAKKGPSGALVGDVVFNSDEGDPSAQPDLQVQAARSIGNGSEEVCDKGPPPLPLGGVPAINPPSFQETQAIANAHNDFGCRFTVIKNKDAACTGSGGSYFFVGVGTTTQFCTLIGAELAFPPGDTLVTARVLDVSGRPGLPLSFVMRVP